MNVDIVEAYYAVASHLEEQATHKREVSEMLYSMASAMSEQRMREKQPETKRCACGFQLPSPGFPCGACGVVSAQNGTGDA